MNAELKEKILGLLIEPNEERWLDPVEITNIVMNQIVPIIDEQNQKLIDDYLELRNYSESMKAQFEDSELEVRRLTEFIQSLTKTDCVDPENCKRWVPGSDFWRCTSCKAKEFLERTK
jgi:hypothetical protein